MGDVLKKAFVGCNISNVQEKKKKKRKKQEGKQKKFMTYQGRCNRRYVPS